MAEQAKWQHNRQKLFDGLKEEGFSGFGNTVEEFGEKLNKENNRATIYNTLKSYGYKGIGDSLDDFTAKVMPPTEVQHVSPQVLAEGLAENQRIVSDFNRQFAARGRELSADVKAQNPRNRFTDGSRESMQYNPNSNKLEATYTLPTGERTFSKTDATLKRLEYNGDMGLTATGQLRQAQKRLAEYEDKLDARAEVLMREHERTKESLPGFVNVLSDIGNAVRADKMGGSTGNTPTYDYAEFVTDPEYNALLSSIRDTEKQIRQLENWVEKEKHGERFWHDFGRGVLQEFVLNPDVWDFGRAGFRQGSTLANISNKLNNNEELTESEKNTLNDLYLLQNVQSEFGDLGTGARWGSIAGQSLSFMKDFALSGPISGGVVKGITRGLRQLSSNAVKSMGIKAAEKASAQILKEGLPTYLATNLATRAATKAGVDATSSLGVEVAEKGLFNYLRSGGSTAAKKLIAEQGVMNTASIITLKALGTTAEDLLIRAPLMATTIQGLTTGTNIIDTKLGPVVFNKETGELQFADDKTWSEAAWQSGMDAVVENMSEMAGAHAPTIVDMARVFGARRLAAGILRTTREGAGTVLSNVNKFLKQAGVNGYLSEVGEEYYGQGWRTLLNLESAYTDADGERKNLISDSEWHADLWGGIGLTIGLTGAASVSVAYPAKGAYNMSVYLKHKHNVRKADKRASKVFSAEQWEPIKEYIDASDNGNVSAIAGQAFKDKNLTPEQKEAIVNYTWNLLIFRGYNLGEMMLSRNGLSSADENVVEAQNSYLDGYNADAGEINNISIALDLQRNKLLELTTPETVAEVEADPIRALSNLGDDPDVNQAVIDFVNAKQTDNGMSQRLIDNLDDAIEESNATADSCVNRSTGMIEEAILNSNGDNNKNNVYVISGNLVANEDNTIDTDKSDNSIIVRDAETGIVSMISPNDILSIFPPVDPNEVKLRTEEALRKLYAQRTANNVSGTVFFTQGDTYTLTDAEGNETQVQVLPNADGIIDNGDGTVNVSADGGNTIVSMGKEEIQSMVDLTNRNRVAQQIAETDAKRVEESITQWRDRFGDDLQAGTSFNILYDGKPVTITITEISNNGIIYYTDNNGEDWQEGIASLFKERSDYEDYVNGDLIPSVSYHIGDTIKAWGDNGRRTTGRLVAESPDGGFEVEFDSPVRGSMVAVLPTEEIQAMDLNLTPGINIGVETSEPPSPAEPSIYIGGRAETILSDEIDENGYPFILSPNGTTTFGEIRENSGLTPAPIKLSEGFQDANGKGYGLAHIEANHGKQIRNAGFYSVNDFVSYVATNYDEDNIRIGKRRDDGTATYLIQITDAHDNTLFIEMSKDGSYWNVNSAGIFRKGYSIKKETVVKSEPQQPNNAVSRGSSLSENGNSGITFSEPNGKPTVSDTKYTNNYGIEQQANLPAEASALSRIPRGDDGELMYEAADVDTAWDAIVEEAGDEAMAKRVVDSMVADKEAALKKAEKQKPRAGTTPSEKIAAERKRKAAIDNARSVLDHWKRIALVPLNRKADENARLRREAEETAKARREAEAAEKRQREEAARIEREMLGGVPDMVDDKASDARARGYRRVNGHAVERQAEMPRLLGKESRVKFSDRDIPVGNWAIIDASQLQPSHIDGRRNPLHFLDEAQPKERKEADSVAAARRMAGNIRAEEITGGATAYSGSPTVNTRGEVIQGNNRSAALREMWQSHPQEAARYKKYLAEHAANFGFSTEAIESMGQPVLVNMIDVSDSKAIELGQFVASDTETGGIERIRPKNTVQKLGGDMGIFASKLLQGGDEEASFSQLLDTNGQEALRWMNSKGIITDTQYRSAFAPNGSLTGEAKNDLRGIMLQGIFQDSITQLETMFEALPAKAQKAILATMWRDFDSPESDRILPEVQMSIQAYYALSHFEAFANAKNYKEARIAAETWRMQYAFDDATGESYLPSERFSNFALLLASAYKAQTQRLLQGAFNRIFDLVQGRQEETLFEKPDNTPLPLAEAIDETIKEFNLANDFRYDGQIRSDVLGGNSPRSREGRRGSGGNAPAGERSEDGEQYPDSAGGTGGNGRRSENSRESGNVQTEIEATESREEKLTEEDALVLIANMEENAEVAPEIELTIENWDALFGENGRVNTPIGEVKMGEHQFAKLMRQGRNGKLGMIKPTLENPDIIIEDNSETKEGNEAERGSSYVYVKTFAKPDGSRFYYFTSVTVSQDGMEVVVSNQEKTKKRISNLLQKNAISWINEKVQSASETQSEKSVSLDDSRTATQADNNTAPLGINSSELLDNKDTADSGISQTLGEKVSQAEAETDTNPTDGQKEKEDYTWNISWNTHILNRYRHLKSLLLTKKGVLKKKYADKLKKPIYAVFDTNDPDSVPFYIANSPREALDAAFNFDIENFDILYLDSRHQNRMKAGIYHIFKYGSDTSYDQNGVFREDIKQKLAEDIGKIEENGVGFQPVGHGAFGDIYDQFRGNAKEAIEFLSEKQGGEAIGALHHKDVGDISLVWGNDKAGLKKILAKHPEITNDIQGILDDMSVVEESDNRIKLDSPTHFAVVSKEIFGTPRDKWLLTAYEKKNSASDNTMDTVGTVTGKQNDTATLRNTVSVGKDSDNPSKKQKLSGNKIVSDEMYEKLKRRYPDHILLIQDGDRYVSAKNDAETIFELTGIPIKEDGSVSFGKDRFNEVMRKIISNGYRAGLIEADTGDNAQAKQKDAAEKLHERYEQAYAEALKKARREKGKDVDEDAVRNLVDFNYEGDLYMDAERILNELMGGKGETLSDDMFEWEMEAGNGNEDGIPSLPQIIDEIARRESGNSMLFQKTGEIVVPTAEEAALRDAIVERLRQSGLEVITDVDAGQRMIDLASGQGEQVRTQTMIDGLEKAANFIAESVKGKKRNQRITIELPSTTIRKIRNVLGRNFDSHNITANSIIHAKKNHGIGGNKITNNSIPLRDEDFSLAPYIMTAPDVVEKGSMDASGRESIRFKKNLSNGYAVVVEKEQKNSPDDMETITMWAELSSSNVSDARTKIRPLSSTSQPANEYRKTNARTVIISSDDAAKIRKDAEDAIKADAKLREHRVFHGSGADFDRFDHSHMSEGEGAQAYGWGTYVTEVEGIGKGYATQKRGRISYKGHSIGEILRLYNEGVRPYNVVLSVVEKMELGYSFEEAKADLEYEWRNSLEYDEQIGNKLYAEGWKKNLSELAMLHGNDFQVNNSRYLYTVEIPDDNGSNYLEYGNPLPETLDKEAMAEAVFRRILETDEDGSYNDDTAREMLRRDLSDSFGEAEDGKTLYGTIAAYLGDKGASVFLHGLGFVGISYPAQYQSGGRKYKAKNYVIFNEDDLQIVDKARFFRTPRGEAYGFTIGGRIYIDPRIASAETPIHEYSHLWASALRHGNAGEWRNVVGLMKGTPAWEETKSRYPELATDDEIADEVLATYSGRRGAERLREQQRKIAGGRGAVVGKAEAIAALEQVKEALRRFWKAVADFLHISFSTAEEVADRVVSDLLEGVNPARTIEEQSIIDRAKADGTYMKAPNGAPTNLTERQWVQVRTRAFKQWFGDWEKAARIDKLRKSDPVVVSGNDYQGKYELNPKSATRYILDNLRGNYVNKDTGETIRISRKGAEKVMKHDVESEVHLKSAVYIPQMIENAIFISEDVNSKEKTGFDNYRYYVVGLRMGSTDYTAKLVVGIKNGAAYYDHALTEIEKNSLLESIDPINTGFANKEAVVSGIKDKRLVSILQTNSSKVVDENGEPRVVYRGSPKKMGTVFEYGHNFYGGNNGFWFTSSPSAAKDYSFDDVTGEYGEIKSVYLRSSKLIDLLPLGKRTTSKKFCDFLRENYDIDLGRGSNKEYLTNELYEKFQNRLYPGAHDGIRMADVAHTYIVKTTTQIKSATGNTGAFSADNEDIRFSLRNLDGLRYREQPDELAEVNERFNEQLQRQIDGTLPKGHVYELGYPSDVLLSAGLPDLPIEMAASRLEDKSMQENHPFDLSEVRDLPNAIQNPMAVFRSATHIGSFVVMTEIEHAGKNFVAAIEANRRKGKIEVNSVRSVYPKTNRQVANWINEELLEYADKKRMAEWLSKQRSNSADVRKQFNHATNIVINFENPNIGEEIFRVGNGALDDDGLSMANDPRARLSGKPRRTARQRREFAERERRRMAERVSALAEKLHLGNVEIVTDASTLQGRRKEAKGFYSRSTGKITIVVPNHASTFDAEQTLLHEAVGHYGLRRLFGDRFDTFLDNVFQNADEDVRRLIAGLSAKHGWDFRTATEEYLASMAEETDFENVNAGWWQKIKAFFLDMLHKIGFEGFTGVTLSDNELRYLLWRSYENLAEPGRHRSILGEAADIVKQDELKVGNYAQREDAAQRVAENSDLLYRNGEDVALGLADRYQKRVTSKAGEAAEAYQDNMRSVKILQEEIAKETGRPIADFENAYDRENHENSINKIEQEQYIRDVMKPTEKVLAKIQLRKWENGEFITFDEIEKYLIAKHGLERNPKFARRDADAIYTETKEELDKNLKDGKIAKDRYNEKLSEAKEKREKNFAKFRKRDYSGLTALFSGGNPNMPVEQLEEAAQKYVDDFESAVAYRDKEKEDRINSISKGYTNLADELWELIRKSKEFTLNKQYKTGLISAELRDRLMNMFDYYVPLRGFADETAGDLYKYQPTDRASKSKNTKLKQQKAEGRTSQAGNILATMMQMAGLSITAGNRNYTNQALLNLALNHPTNLLTVSGLYYMQEKGTGKWMPVYPEISENMSAEERQKAVSDFESRCKEVIAKEKALPLKDKTIVRMEKGLLLPIRMDAWQKQQHSVRVQRGGEEYVVFVNGDPRAAEALNGLLDKRALEWAARFTRWVSANVTSRNPEFLVSNAARDFQSAVTTILVDSGYEEGYLNKFLTNYHNNFSPIAFRGARKGHYNGIYALYRKYEKGELDMNNERERYFKEFLENGGETGYTQLWQIDKLDKELKNMTKLQKGGFDEAVAFTKQALTATNNVIEFANRGIENATRFSAYMTSRQMGKSVLSSINDAKDISVNFNRHGSGALGYAYFKSLFMFLNPAIQGLAKEIRLFRGDPAKASLFFIGIPIALGALVPFAMMLLADGGDPEDYFGLTAHTRQNNLVLGFNGNYIKMPLPPELRAFYGVGEAIASHTLNDKQHGNMGLEIANSLSQLFPRDIVDARGLIDSEHSLLTGVIKGITPDMFKVPLEAYVWNENFAGYPITSQYDWNASYPEYLRSDKNTPKWMIETSKFINESTGGTARRKGWADSKYLNPSAIEHITTSYLGGMFTFGMKMGKTIAMIWDEEMRDSRNVPVVSRLYQHVDAGAALKRYYNEMSILYANECEADKAEFNYYYNQEGKGIFDKAFIVSEEMQQNKFKRWIIAEPHIKRINELRREYNKQRDEGDTANLENTETELQQAKKEFVDKMDAFDSTMEIDPFAYNKDVRLYKIDLEYKSMNQKLNELKEDSSTSDIMDRAAQFDALYKTDDYRRYMIAKRYKRVISNVQREIEKSKDADQRAALEKEVSRLQDEMIKEIDKPQN